jgi:hypothetical protein
VTATLDAVTKKKDGPEPSAEQKLAEELVAQAVLSWVPSTLARQAHAQRGRDGHGSWCPARRRAAWIGPVGLPPGRRHYCDEDDRPVAWVTGQRMADAGRAWLAMSGSHAETGLVPVLLAEAHSGARDAGMLPDFGFFWPAEVGLLDQMSARDVLAAGWG